MSAIYSQKIADAVISCITENGWTNYVFDRTRGIIKLKFRVEGSIDHIRLLLDLHEHFYLAYGCIEMNVNEAYRREAALYLTWVNYRINFGNFEMDMQDGEIRYKYPVDCDNIEPSFEIIDRSIGIPVGMFSRYGDGLLKVMFGMASAEEAYKAAGPNL